MKTGVIVYVASDERMGNDFDVEEASNWQATAITGSIYEGDR
jgi:hypothetical protein